MKKILFYLLAISAIFVSVYAIIGYLILTPGSSVTPAMMEVYRIHRLTIVFHALFASIALAIGVPQMSHKFREKYPKLNLTFRKIYFISVIIASITGFMLAFTSQGGLVNTFGFGILAVIWFYSCIRAILADRSNDMPAFRLWMVRNYTLTFAAVTLRIYLGLFFATLGYDQFDNFYPTLGFLCWVPNIVVSEWFLIPWLSRKSK